LLCSPPAASIKISSGFGAGRIGGAIRGAGRVQP
jgi:hypothetical protein